MFYTDMLENVNSFNNPSKLTESFVKVCKALYAERKFYFACFQYVGQNSLFESLYEIYYELWKINIDMGYSECGFKLSESELNLMAKLKAHALVGIIKDWVDEGMHDNYMKYFEQIREILDSESLGYSILSNQRMMEKRAEEFDKKSNQKEEFYIAEHTEEVYREFVELVKKISGRFICGRTRIQCRKIWIGMWSCYGSSD